MKHVRVLIADDHPVIIAGLTTALNRFEVKVVDSVGTVDEVVDKYAETKVDVIVLDIRFAGSETGLDVARQLLERFPQARIVFYSQFDDDEIIAEAYRLGGFAFVPKSSNASMLADAIKDAHAGRRYFPKEIAERLALIGVRGDDSPQSRLEPRELDIFKLIAEGFSNVEIGEKISMSEKTVRQYRNNIKEKLGLERDADITRLAVKHMMLAP